MKTIKILFLALFIAANFANAQDTLYVYKEGAVIYKQAVTGVDSITFTNTKIAFPTQGLVAWYPFNGNANDESGNGNNGTVNGVTLTADRFGNTNKAYDFNGSNAYIQVANSQSLQFSQSQQTISFWIKITSYPNDNKEHYIIDKMLAQGTQSSGFHIFISNFTSQNYLTFRYMNRNNIWGQANIPFLNIPLSQF